MFDVPVAFFGYKRPELSREVLRAIRAVRPSMLLVVADGPRDASEMEPCERVRSLFETDVDWECTVLRRFAPANLGCARGVSGGLEWVFGQVDRAIVLEDDTLPDISFFSFCRELLARYENDERVMQISGSNMAGRIESGCSYGFSKYTLPPWGWASWARAWRRYRFSMDFWDEEKQKIADRLGTAFPVWAGLLERYRRRLPSWDIQWNVALWRHAGLTVIPSANLVSNTGHGDGATFTRWSDSQYANMQRFQCPAPLAHPASYAEDFDSRIEPKLLGFLEELRELHWRS